MKKSLKNSVKVAFKKDAGTYIVIATTDTGKELSTISFGSVTIQVEHPSIEEIKKNILSGQMALARAEQAFITKGVQLKVRAGSHLTENNMNVRVSQALTGHIKQLAERYAEPLPQLAADVAALHLQRMGVAL
ncbi:MAG: hypothetical protein Q8L73_09760 [Methylotenera sp.]|nr:hypothetical protein [Methylotenera sp.]